MKNRLLRLIVIGVVALMPSLGLAQSSYEVQFGNLYGADHHLLPTKFLSGTGPLDPVLYGRDFFVICLQEDLSPVIDLTALMYAGDSPDILTAGVWADMGAERYVTTSAARNMYYHNISEILADTTGEGAGLSFQFATWYITTAFEQGIWSGTLDLEKIADIIVFGEALFPRPEAQQLQIRSYLYTSLEEAEGEIYFLQSPDNPDYQPFAIFVIPEPSTIALTAFAFGAMIIGFRRNKTLRVKDGHPRRA